MGTNYYIKGYKELDDPYLHIGKRSAAGRYCFDCGITLCKDGKKAIHFGESLWHNTCPKCGKAPALETLETSSGGLELGFNKHQAVKKQGVRTCSSFTWAMQDEVVLAGHIQALGMTLNEPSIVDEYGREFTIKEFCATVDSCPIHFYDSIGVEFS